MSKQARIPAGYRALGVSLAALGLIVNKWSLAKLYGTEQINTSLYVFLIVLLELFLVASGVGIYARGKVFFKKLSLWTVTFLLVVFAVEAGLRIIAMVSGKDAHTEAGVFYEIQSNIGRELIKDFVSEYTESERLTTYESYIGWRRKEYRGKFINVDLQGFRRTANYEPLDSGAKRLYVFGGSTVWGFGSRDDYTIPSVISHQLHSKGYRFHVLNCGETAYAFKQEIIYLMLLLRDGHRPDYVIFYDGVDDVLKAHNAGTPMGHYLASQFRATLLSRRPLIRSVIDGLVVPARESSMIYKALSQIPALKSKPVEKYDGEETLALGKDIINEYRKSLDLLDKLSGAYGFKYLCFWQPSIYTEKKLIGREADIKALTADRSLGRLYEVADSLSKEIVHPSFFNISNVLDGRTGPVYIDFCHLSEAGDNIVAGAITEIFERALKP